MLSLQRKRAESNANSRVLMEPSHLENRMDALRSRISDLRGYL